MSLLGSLGMYGDLLARGAPFPSRAPQDLPLTPLGTQGPAQRLPVYPATGGVTPQMSLAPGGVVARFGNPPDGAAAAPAAPAPAALGGFRIPAGPGYDSTDVFRQASGLGLPLQAAASMATAGLGGAGPAMPAERIPPVPADPRYEQILEAMLSPPQWAVTQTGTPDMMHLFGAMPDVAGHNAHLAAAGLTGAGQLVGSQRQLELQRAMENQKLALDWARQNLAEQSYKEMKGPDALVRNMIEKGVPPAQAMANMQTARAMGLFPAEAPKPGEPAPKDIPASDPETNMIALDPDLVRFAQQTGPDNKPLVDNPLKVLEYAISKRATPTEPGAGEQWIKENWKPLRQWFAKQYPTHNLYELPRAGLLGQLAGVPTAGFTKLFGYSDEAARQAIERPMGAGLTATMRSLAGLPKSNAARARDVLAELTRRERK